MLKKILFISFCCILFSGVASGGVDASKFTQTWGGGIFTECGGRDLPDTACIGKDKCVNGSIAGDENAWLMMIAYKINEHCAYFCPTQLEAHNHNKRKCWTEYVSLGLGNDCVWLCKDGNWQQLDEEIANPSEYCEPKTFKQNDYDNYSVIYGLSSTKNIEGKIPMFQGGNKPGCGVSGYQEHDMILAIKKYLPNGHGAYVQQVMFRADGHGYDSTWSEPQIYPARDSAEILVCSPGYKPSGDDCVQATRQCELEERLANLCSDWPRESFKSEIHDLVKKGDCYQYRCKTAGEAFPDIVDKSCSKCIESVNKDGVNPADGVCVRCQTGYVFDADNAADNYCSVTRQLNKQNLQYGIKTQNPDAIKKLMLPQQCWTKGTTDEYADCVKAQ